MKPQASVAIILALTGCMSFNHVDVSLRERFKEYEEKLVWNDLSTHEKIAIIDIDGIIDDDSEDSLFRSKESMIVSVVEKLKKAEADPVVKAVILRIDSPGGSVTASDVLYEEIRAFKARKAVPVVAAFMGVAASGGYYVSCACDRIVAHPTTITGSIGVIALHVSLAGLLEKAGIKVEALKSGAHKDTGSIFRDLAPDERKVLQALIDDMHGRFVSVVARGRQLVMTEAQAHGLADGRIYSADQALKVKLIDRIGYLKDAVEEAKILAGMKGAKVVLYTRRPESAENVYSPARASASADSAVLDLARRALTFQLCYLWEPGLLGK
ncbi:MAG TPA: signal peptide peptidase SppA [Planctomycetota bacterium]|nr:signal peptide peptidase SppA [Planctomycetota bacterium]